MRVPTVVLSVCVELALARLSLRSAYSRGGRRVFLKPIGFQFDYVFDK